MWLNENYKDRTGERITPIILSEVVCALGNTHWWVKIKGKCYAPHELTVKYHLFQHCKIGDMSQVDPREELARADKILAELQKRRDEFAARIEHFKKGVWH